MAQNMNQGNISLRNSKGQFVKGHKSEKSFEMRQKISKTLMGHSVSEEVRSRISKKLVGRKLTKEHAEKVKLTLTSSKNQMGDNNPNYKHGLTLTKEYMNFQKYKNKMKRRGIEGSHTEEEWLMLKKTYQNMCLCCKRIEPEIKLTKDHIIPLTKSGTDDIWNIQPLCGSCNSRKWAREIDYRERMVI